MSELRLLRLSDLEMLMELTRLAGCTQTREDWLRLLELAPEGCLGVEEQGRIIASTSAVSYGRELAWIGMVLTHPEHREQGHARSLVDHSVDLLRHRGVSYIKVDASGDDKPIYENLGFTGERPVERWRRMPAPYASQGSDNLHPFVYDPLLERIAFGANRQKLLRSLASHPNACIPGKGFAIERPAAEGAIYFGPCVARTTGAARSLLHWFLSRHAEEEALWDLLPDNIEALQLANESGFEPVDRHTRMVLAARTSLPPLVTNESSVFAIAGPELG